MHQSAGAQATLDTDAHQLYALPKYPRPQGLSLQCNTTAVNSLAAQQVQLATSRVLPAQQHLQQRNLVVVTHER